MNEKQNKILDDRQLFRALSSHSVPLWPWENWYCRVGHFQRQNHRNEDGQSTESERMSGRCGEYAKLIDRPRNISCPAVIGLPKWGTCRWGDWQRFFCTRQEKRWSLCHHRHWNENIETEKLGRMKVLDSRVASFPYHWPGETYLKLDTGLPASGWKKVWDTALPLKNWMLNLVLSTRSKKLMNSFPPKIEGCVWTKPGIWDLTNKDLQIECLAQLQP